MLFENIYIGDVASKLSLFLSNYAYSKIIVLTDTVCQKHCLPILHSKIPMLRQAPLIVVATGEVNKNIATCTYIWQQLIDLNADRNALLINLGGGVIGDMGGFAAATYKRGIHFVQIPTTLLAQVDASVGGKLAIDFQGLKNLIGLFQEPKAVFIDPEFLATLAPRQIRSGYAEMIKHALIADKTHYNALLLQIPTNKHFHTNMDICLPLISRSIAIKQHIVAQDPTEKGLRKILNFGHSIGHAIESWSLQNDKEPLLHGEAVALGMMLELYLSHLLLGFPEAALHETIMHLKYIVPNYNAIFQAMPIDELLIFIQNDKKNKENKWLFSLLRQIAEPVWDIEVQPNTVKNVLYWAVNIL